MKYKVTLAVLFNAVAIVKADSEEHAQELITDMECTPCVHGSFLCGEYFAENDLVLDDGTELDKDFNTIEIEEYEG